MGRGPDDVMIPTVKPLKQTPTSQGYVCGFFFFCAGAHVRLHVNALVSELVFASSQRLLRGTDTSFVERFRPLYVALRSPRVLSNGLVS